ncbi:MAG: ATPase [archaeon]|nr:ATPase [archaeon]
MKVKIDFVFGSLLVVLSLMVLSSTPALAIDAPSQALQIEFGAMKVLSAAAAFGLAALAAGWAISRAGSAGMAGAAERPEIRTTVIIITALGEAIAIYGIVIAILILGQTA